MIPLASVSIWSSDRNSSQRESLQDLELQVQLLRCVASHLVPCRVHWNVIVPQPSYGDRRLRGVTQFKVHIVQHVEQGIWPAYIWRGYRYHKNRVGITHWLYPPKPHKFRTFSRSRVRWSAIWIDVVFILGSKLCPVVHLTAGVGAREAIKKQGTLYDNCVDKSRVYGVWYLIPSR